MDVELRSGQPNTDVGLHGDTRLTQYINRIVRLCQFVRGTDRELHQIPESGNRDVLYAKIEYGEGQADDVGLNLRTRACKSDDNAGVINIEGIRLQG